MNLIVTLWLVFLSSTRLARHMTPSNTFSCEALSSPALPYYAAFSKDPYAWVTHKTALLLPDHYPTLKDLFDEDYPGRITFRVGTMDGQELKSAAEIERLIQKSLWPEQAVVRDLVTTEI